MFRMSCSSIGSTEKKKKQVKKEDEARPSKVIPDKSDMEEDELHDSDDPTTDAF